MCKLPMQHFLLLYKKMKKQLLPQQAHLAIIILQVNSSTADRLTHSPTTGPGLSCKISMIPLPSTSGFNFQTFSSPALQERQEVNVIFQKQLFPDVMTTTMLSLGQSKYLLPKLLSQPCHITLFSLSILCSRWINFYLNQRHSGTVAKKAPEQHAKIL